MRPELAIVHLQLTRRCNLHCRFCGQEHVEPTEALGLAEWLDVLRQLKDYAPGATVVLWGGEPLLYPEFDAVASHAAAAGFPLELVTNGTNIHRFVGLLRRCFRRIYVSVDGPEVVHDAIRGRGVFSLVRDNLAMLADGMAEIVMMSVLVPENMDSMAGIPFGLPVHRVILHEMIYLNDVECRSLSPNITRRWQDNAVDGYSQRLVLAIEQLKRQRFAVPVEFQPHFAGGFCREPYRHLHVCVDGETSFCTDFTNVSLGNIRRQTIREIFEGERTEAFRRNGNQPFCSHCSWKNTHDTIVRLN